METPAAPAPETPVAAPDGAQCPRVPGWRRCLRGLRGALPPDVGREVVELMMLAGPVFLAQLMTFLISIVSSIFCGHLGRAELDAVMLAVSVVNVSGISIGTGLASACDTLMSQSFGGRNLKRVGVILQRGVLILLLCCLPCWAIFINTESLLRLLKQDPEVSRSAASPASEAPGRRQRPSAFLPWLHVPGQSGIILPQVITGIVANILNVGMNALLLSALDLGMGSAWANTTSQFFLCALLFLYLRWKKIHVDTWGGWTMDCFQEWGSFIQLAIPSMFMVCIEWWTFEVGTFLAGLSRVQRKPVNSLANHVSRVPLGFGVAASVRVGNALGAGNPEQARHSGVTESSLWTVLTDRLGGSVVVINAAHSTTAFASLTAVSSSHRAIISLVSRVMPIFAPFHLFDALAGTSGGVLRGTGKQKMGAFSNAIGYYVFGFPLGVSLMFAAHHGIIGECLVPCQRATEARVYFCTLFCSRRCHTVGVTVAGPRALKSGRVRPAWLFFFPFVLTIQGPCVSTECEDQLFHFCKKAHWNFLFLSQGCPKAGDCFGGILPSQRG
uniref:Multidrug and toxin extrusion protein n=1 Tax=Sus scrofa TaxID=9823 RepID=A0A8D1R3H9_PIG